METAWRRARLPGEKKKSSGKFVFFKTKGTRKNEFCKEATPPYECKSVEWQMKRK